MTYEVSQGGIDTFTASTEKSGISTVPGGFCVWFTGLPCSGKSTLALALKDALECRNRTVTVLDGDAVRAILCPDLKFSRADRYANVIRIAFVAKEVVRHGGAVICATISPYRKDRDLIRTSFAGLAFLEVYVNTPLSVCEQRDVKGLYALARRGEILNFTGVDDPYEAPLNPDIICNTQASSPTDCIRPILDNINVK